MLQIWLGFNFILLFYKKYVFYIKYVVEILVLYILIYTKQILILCVYIFKQKFFIKHLPLGIDVNAILSGPKNQYKFYKIFS